MISPKDIELELDEAEDYLKSGDIDLAKAKFNMALSLLGQLAKFADRAGPAGGALAGMTTMEILDALNDGLDHPLFNAIIGGVLGYVGGKKASEMYKSSMSPLWVRAFNGMGDVCRANGDFTQARKYYATALEAEPDNPIIRAKLAEVS